MIDTDQFQAWNGPEGLHWVSNADRYDAMQQRLTPYLLAAAQITDDDRVLDIGCGAGLTTRSAARATPGGLAVGVDVSAPLIEEARSRTARENLPNVRFEHGDAQTHPFPADGFDVVISRNGVMFFDDPSAAFGNIARAVRPGGRLAFLCWQDPLHNEWILTLGASIAAHVPLPELGGDGPGPFSLADPQQSRDLLEAAGFTDVDVEPVTEPLRLGADPDDVVSFAGDVGLIRDLVADAEQSIRDAVFADIRTALTRYQRPDGVWLGSAAWLVTGRRAQASG